LSLLCINHDLYNLDVFTNITNPAWFVPRWCVYLGSRGCSTRCTMCMQGVVMLTNIRGVLITANVLWLQ